MALLEEHITENIVKVRRMMQWLGNELKCTYSDWGQLLPPDDWHPSGFRAIGSTVFFFLWRSRAEASQVHGRPPERKHA